jgi:hypothetical protein
VRYNILSILSDDGNNVSAGIERILQVYNFVIKSFTYSHK